MTRRGARELPGRSTLHATRARGPRRAPHGASLWLGGVVVLLGAVLYVVGSLRYSLPEAVAAVLLGACVAALVPWALSVTGQGAERAFWASTPREEAVPLAPLDYRLVRLRRDLRDAVERDDRHDDVYPVLRELTAERLRALHDVDLDTEPERARAVVDPALWRYLASPPTDTRKRSRTALQTAIEGIEKL